jgi:hypothetical protein
MSAHFRRAAAIALTLALFLPSAIEVSTATAQTAALSPPSNPLGEGDHRAITNNSLAQRVVLYEEEPGNPQGRRAIGSVVWSAETIAGNLVQFENYLERIHKAPERAVRADIDIPERNMGVTWRLRRGADPGSSTSHIIEFLFKLPPDFDGGGILKVPGFWMKPSAQRQGTALAGLSFKVWTGYFLIGLSAAPADRERNLQQLKDQAWIDIPIVYTNNRRAILSMEKGTPGEQAFQQAFAAWNE